MDVYEVAPGLYQSGGLTPTNSWLEQGISVVVDLEGSIDAHVPGDASCLYVWWPINDGEMPSPEIVRSLAHFVKRLLEDGRRVLVHCSAGLNRSGLVNARVLIAQGMEPEDAVAQIRARRDAYALCNQNFVDWLMKEVPGT